MSQRDPKGFTLAVAHGLALALGLMWATSLLLQTDSLRQRPQINNPGHPSIAIFSIFGWDGGAVPLAMFAGFPGVLIGADGAAASADPKRGTPA